MAIRYIPFYETGHPMTYTQSEPTEQEVNGADLFITQEYGRKICWRKNFVFEAILSFAGFERGRSSAHAIFVEESSQTQYQMFLKDFGDMFKYGVAGRQIHAKFTFVKRGKNYGIKYVESVPLVYPDGDCPGDLSSLIGTTAVVPACTAGE